MSSRNRPSELAAYSSLFERLLDPIVLIDRETFEILETNDACERVLGISSEDLMGKPITSHFREDQRETCEKALRIARRRFYPYFFEANWVVSPEKSLTLQITTCSLQLSDGREVIQFMAKDITREREAEAKADTYFKELQAANAKLHSQATTDEMTGLANFRHFKSQLAIEHERAERYKTIYSLVFIDIDHFKNYNDKNGHPAGDALLREFGTILQGQVRRTDLAARYGGEEFVVLCPGVSWKDVGILAERIRKAVEAHPFAFAEKQPLGKVTISVGIASYPHDGKSAQDIITAADEAVYVSKRSGRNQVTASSEKAKKQGKAA